MPLGEYFPATLAAARQGSTWAWVAIYRDLYAPLHGHVVASGLGDEADRLVSETFLGTARDIHRFDGDGVRFRAWVYAIARQQMEAEWRARGRDVALPHDTTRVETFVCESEAEGLSDVCMRELRAVIRSLKLTERESRPRVAAD